MAYLGVVGVLNNQPAHITYSRYVIATVLLGTVIGQFASHGGYVYVS